VQHRKTWYLKKKNKYSQRKYGPIWDKERSTPLLGKWGCWLWVLGMEEAGFRSLLLVCHIVFGQVDHPLNPERRWGS
jgi:hypothetical protein